MPQVIEVRSMRRDESDREARRLQSIIGQERADAIVIPRGVDQSFMDEVRPRRLPVFRINGVVVWEGQDPPADIVRVWLHWPRTVGEAVERLLEKIDTIPEDRDARARLRAEISTAFGLWGANLDLLRSCGFEFMCADYATDLIVARARQELDRRTRLIN
jgi:hypothetical protein